MMTLAQLCIIYLGKIRCSDPIIFLVHEFKERDQIASHVGNEEVRHGFVEFHDEDPAFCVSHDQQCSVGINWIDPGGKRKIIVPQE